MLLGNQDEKLSIIECKEKEKTKQNSNNISF
jgi:hypothetical protein